MGHFRKTEEPETKEKKSEKLTIRGEKTRHEYQFYSRETAKIRKNEPVSLPQKANNETMIPPHQNRNPKTEIDFTKKKKNVSN